MTDNTEALPRRLYARSDLCRKAGAHDMADLLQEAAMVLTTRAALAQRQQVPEGWTIHLDTDAAETLKQTIGDDDTVSEITLSLCDGHEGRGLYVWLTEYPEEGSLLLAAAPALTAAPSAQAEPQEPLPYGFESGLVQLLNEARCLEKRVVGNRELASRIVDYIRRGISKQEGTKA